VGTIQSEKKELREKLIQRDFVRPEGELQPGGEGAEDSVELAEAALDAALGKKAINPVLLDVRGLCSYTSYILLVSGRSDRQVDAISAAVHQRLKEREQPLGTEGLGTGQWALLDYGDVIVHVFLPAVREHYDLEGLWIDAPRVHIDVPEDARPSAEDRYGPVNP